VDFFTVFVRDGGVVCGAGVCSEDYAIFVNEADNGGTRFVGEGGDIIFGGPGRGFLELGFDEGVAVDIVEVEAAGGGGGI